MDENARKLARTSGPVKNLGLRRRRKGAGPNGSVAPPDVAVCVLVCCVGLCVGVSLSGAHAPEFNLHKLLQF